MSGLAEIRGQGKEHMLGQFHRSLGQWKKLHPGAPSFNAGSGDLIGIFDGIWFKIDSVRYTCLVILVRPIRADTARVRGLYLVTGNESEANWHEVLHQTLKPKELARIRAIVADGAHGLVALSRTYGWKYQRCHFHLLKDLQLISGKRSGPTQALRQTALRVTREILDTPDERKAERLKQQLIRLIVRPDCPKTVRKKIGGFLKHFSKFRTCYHFPEFRLPHTSNGAECIGRFVRERLGIMRGLRTVHSLKFWLDVLKRERPTIRSLPKLPTKL